MSTEPWQIDEPPTIGKTLRKLGQPERDQYRIAIKTLAHAHNPRTHGQFKATLGCFVYYLTKSYRLKYNVNDADHVIEIRGIGDHKEIYGKDKHS